MTNFRMNWYDFENHQFVYDGKTYSLCRGSGGGNLPFRHYILFLLNIHQGRFVSADDVISYIWGDKDPDDWPDNQVAILKNFIGEIRKRLPAGVYIKNWHGCGYKLVIGEEVAERNQA